MDGSGGLPFSRSQIPFYARLHTGLPFRKQQEQPFLSAYTLETPNLQISESGSFFEAAADS